MLLELLVKDATLWRSLWLLLWLVLPFLLCLYAAYRMAAHAGIPHPWLAFLPLVGYYYIMGKLAEPSGFHRTGRNRWPSFWYPFWSTVWIALDMIAKVDLPLPYSSVLFPLAAGGYLLSRVAVAVLDAYVLYSILWDRLSRQAGLYTFLSMLLPLEGIFLLLVMDLVPRSLTGKKQYPEGQPRYDKDHRWQEPPKRQKAARCNKPA